MAFDRFHVPPSPTKKGSVMKLEKISLLAILVLSLSACGTVPQSRAHYIELMKEPTGFGPFQRMAFSKVVARPFDKVVANIDDKLRRCVPGGYTQTTMSGGGMSTLSVQNNQRVERVSRDKAEVTVQQYHSSTAMQSEGGFYLLAADVLRRDKKSVRIDFYTAKHYAGIADAIEKWAQGSKKCRGIGGNA
jgi:hypothetical protein